MKETERTEPVEGEAEGPRLWSRRIRTEVAREPDAGKQTELPGVAVCICTSGHCDFVLTDPTISRVHVHLQVERDAIRVLKVGNWSGQEGAQAGSLGGRPGAPSRGR